MVVLAAMRSRGAQERPAAPNCPSTSWAPFTSQRACGNMLRPCSFRTSRRPTRLKRRSPSRDSSSFNAALVADWESEMSLAAAVVLPARAIATKICS